MHSDAATVGTTKTSRGTKRDILLNSYSFGAASVMNRARHAMSRALLCSQSHATALCGDMLAIYHTMPGRSAILAINKPAVH